MFQCGVAVLGLSVFLVSTRSDRAARVLPDGLTVMVSNVDAEVSVTDAGTSTDTQAAGALGDESFPVRGSISPMPARGFITCCNSSIPTSTMLASLVAYLKAGGRLIDTAPGYAAFGFSEAMVGEAVRASEVPRKEVWLSSKVDTDGWNRDAAVDPKAWVLQQVENTLAMMRVSYIDVMTLHFGPAQVAFQVMGQVPRIGAAGHMGPAQHVQMWRGLMEAKRAGKVLNIGVCETSRSEIENLIAQTGETPGVIVTWYNPWTPAVHKDYVRWAQSKGIHVVAYGLFNWKWWNPQYLRYPFTPPVFPTIVDQDGYSGTAALEAAKKAGKRHGVTFGQICIQWALEEKISFVSPIYHPGYLAEDLKKLDFSLDDEDRELLASVPAQACTSYAVVQIIPGCMP